ncbi:MAG: 2-oxoglutarate ferredoxin oxidoreductase subunit gamma, partial [Bacteroidetes bacterium HGW-Bacteroidetes-22]
TAMGSAKTFNMIVLGAFLKLKPIVKMENVEKGLAKSLPARHHKSIPMNMKAIAKGLEIVEKV